MFLENEVLVKINKKEIYDITKTLINNKIEYQDFYIENNNTYLVTFYKNIKALKKIFGNRKVKIIKYYGLNGIVNFIRKHIYLLISFIISYIILIGLSNTIFSIEIITNNQELKSTILEHFKIHGIEKYKFKKSYEELKNIKNEILRENKDKIEWLEIEEKGTKYIVELTQRIIIEESKENSEPKNVIASKDGLIMYIVSRRGTILKKVNDYVKKGDILITGNIMKNDEIKAQVEADGDVFGEVWYTVTTTVPYNYIEYKSTGKIINHYYLDIFGKRMTLLGKYNTKYQLSETTEVVNKPYLFFKLMKEKKEIYDYIEVNLTENEAYNEALKRSEKSIKVKLKDGESIIDKKVLKKTAYSSKIEVEVFYRVYENIAGYSIIINNVEENNDG